MNSTNTQRGAVLITALFMAITVSGLAVALLAEGSASDRMHTRADDSARALQSAETGLTWAEMEISAQRDTQTDGIGNLSGTYAGSTFQVAATQDPVRTDEWLLRSVGRSGLGARTIEVRLRRLPTGPWGYGLFAKQTITMSGGITTTDSYDSRLGTYASQATNSDAVGTYANARGSIGTNAGGITISGGGRVRGDAAAGPSYTTSLSGGSTVSGSKTPRTEQLDLTPTPISVFQQALATNHNGLWTTTGGTTWNATTKALTVSGGNTLTLTGSTYFFTNLTLSGGSILRITGPVKIYATGNVDFSGGTVVNTSERAVNFQIYAYPHAVPTTFTPPTSPTVKLSGGSTSAYAVYAPAAAVTISGGAGVYGAVIGRTITPSGGSRIHYDEALADQLGGPAKIRRFYWRDLQLPRR